MPFSFADLLYGIVLPMLAAAFLSWRMRRWSSRSESSLATITALIGGFHLGYWLLSLGNVRPESHWEWLPWVLLLTFASVVPLPANRRFAFALTTALTVIVAGAAAWLLVPTWDHLEPSRLVYGTVFVSSVTLIVMLLEPVARHSQGMSFPAVLAAVMTTAAILLALSGSLRFAQMAGCGVAALAGISLAEGIRRSQTTHAGLALPFTLLISLMMLIGRVNSFSDVPLICYLLLPLAPLTLWATHWQRGAEASPKGWRSRIGFLLPLAVSAVAVGIAAF